jgi:hypothetical protein
VCNWVMCDSATYFVVIESGSPIMMTRMRLRVDRDMAARIRASAIFVDSSTLSTSKLGSSKAGERIAMPMVLDTTEENFPA